MLYVYVHAYILQFSICFELKFFSPYLDIHVCLCAFVYVRKCIHMCIIIGLYIRMLYMYHIGSHCKFQRDRAGSGTLQSINKKV